MDSPRGSFSFRTPWQRGATVAGLALVLTATAQAGNTATATAADTATGSGDLSEVVVSARTLEDTLPEQLAGSGVKVEVVTADRIAQGAYTDVASALQNLAPSLWVFNEQGPFSYDEISLLGSRTEDVLFLVDGIRVNNRLYAGTPPLDTMASGVVDHLEVLDGGQALFYGTQAVAGAVNIVTRPFTASATGAATLGLDSNGGKHIDAHFSDSAPFGQYVIYGSNDQSPGYRQFREQDYQPSATQRKHDYNVLTLGLKYGIDFTPDLRLEAGWQRTNADVSLIQPARVARDVNMRREDLGTLKLDYQVTSSFGLYVKAYYHNWHTDYDTYYNSLTEPGTIDVLYQDAFWGYKDRGINALGKFDFGGGLSAYFGYDMQNYGGRDEVLEIQQNNETTNAGFAQLRYTPPALQRLTLAVGGRYNSPSVGDKAAIWNASGKYDIGAGLYVKGEAGTNFRLPTAEELFANDPQDERGNPDLKPESSHSYNLSVGQAGVSLGAQNLHWELTGFARDIHNLIDYATYDAVTGQDVFGNVPGTVRVRGAQGEFGSSFGRLLSGSLSYTYNHSVSDGQQIDNIPRGVFKANLDLHGPGDRYGATLGVLYTGSVSRSVGAFGETQYGKYATVNLSGRYRLDETGHQLLNVAITNLFNRQYGLPGQSCLDVAGDGPYDCSGGHYEYLSLGQPLTVSVSYTYKVQ